jgi:hypothetical protein
MEIARMIRISITASRGRLLLEHLGSWYWTLQHQCCLTAIEVVNMCRSKQVCKVAPSACRSGPRTKAKIGVLKALHGHPLLVKPSRLMDSSLDQGPSMAHTQTTPEVAEQASVVIHRGHPASTRTRMPGAWAPARYHAAPAWSGERIVRTQAHVRACADRFAKQGRKERVGTKILVCRAINQSVLSHCVKA